MRKIKFRAWDREVERFIFSDQTYDDAWFEFKNGKLKAFALHGMDAGSTDEPPQPICDELEDPQEYTGLKDRNAVEIYEGDTVKIDSQSYGSFYAVIEYFSGSCKFGAATWGNKAKQVMMPKNREWNRPYKPCECDGAMYEAMSILETHDTFAEKTETVEVVGNIHEHPEILKEQS